jgi:hypothetical protein
MSEAAMAPIELLRELLSRTGAALNEIGIQVGAHVNETEVHFKAT